MIKNPISYPGNKNKLLNEIVVHFPKDINYFVDVFCGSGVVGVNSPATNVVCNDICFYATQMLEYFYKNNFEKIIADLEKIIEKYGLTYSRIKPKGFYKEYKHEGLSNYNRKGYNELKLAYNQNPTVDKLVILVIYGFNHYLRFNSKNEFNVPVGKVDLSKSIYDNLKLFVGGIKNKRLSFSNLDFREASLYENPNALYYFDPPYLITNAPYNLFWDEEKELALYKILDDLNSRNIKFCLSNVILSNGKENEILKNWSSKYHVLNLKRQYRNANYQKKNITDSIEVLVTNF